MKAEMNLANHALLHVVVPPPRTIPTHILFEIRDMRTDNFDFLVDYLDFHKDSSARRLADNLIKQSEIIQMPEQEAYDMYMARKR